MRLSIFASASVAAVLVLAAARPAASASVEVTPLGSHEGEFCKLDRAMVFEDPDGTRILYDAGRTVRGPDDPRLGEIDAVLLSHMHGDHLGDAVQPEANAGTCDSPDFSVKTTPQSNTVDIAVGKDAALVIGSQMRAFFQNKLEKAGGDAERVRLVRYGASTKIGGVTITTVPAVHANGVSPAFLEGDLAEQLETNGLTAYAGPPNGYVLEFTNGLIAYLSGDTGITAEQEAVVRRHYGANFAVLNIGDVFTTGPEEAAWVINELVRPASVIPSHANEVATEGGDVKPDTRTETFIEAIDVPAHVPLSGRTMAFDGDGRCASGC